MKTKVPSAVGLLALTVLLAAVSPVSAASTITSVKLTGPTELICPPPIPGTYTLTISGTGANGGTEWFNFAVYDDDAWDVDDMLQNETVWYITGENGAWTHTETFQLWCDNHNITGSYGSSWEGSASDPAEVYAKVEYGYGTDAGDSQIINVICIVPEPGAASLFLLGLGILGWRKLS